MCGTTTTKKAGGGVSSSTATTMEEEEGKSKNDIPNPTPSPLLIKPLLSIYRMIPKLHLPLIKNYNFGFSILSALGLSIIRQYIIWPLLTKVWGWPIYTKMTTDAASSLTSIVHSMILVLYLGICFYNIPKPGYIPSARLSKYPIWYQDSTSALLEFCTGYMIFDSFFLIWDTLLYLQMEKLSEFDILVLAHHALTSMYMISCRHLNAGTLSAMILMFTGEITNPIMNGMFTTRFAIQLDCCSTSTTILKLHAFLEYTFALIYCLFRIIIGPICSIHLTYDLLLTKHGRHNVPFIISLIWTLMVWAVIYGSIPFVEECIEMIHNGYGQLKYSQDYDYGERFQIRRQRQGSPPHYYSPSSDEL